MIPRQIKRVTRMVATLTLAVAVAGCATVSPEVEQAKALFQDNCAAHRQPFEKTKAERDQRYANNIAGGALGGAVIVAALGGDPREVLAGAVAGGLGGYAAAYAKDAERRGATQSSLKSFLDRDARQEAARNDQLVNSLLKLNACRLDQIDQIRSDVRAKRLSPEQGRTRALVVRDLTREDNRLVNSVSGSSRSYQGYVGVLSQADINAATRTRAAVSNYTPKVQSVKRTSRGRAAVAVAPRPSAPTNVAASEISRVRLDAAARAANDSAVAAANALIGDLDSATPI